MKKILLTLLPFILLAFQPALFANTVIIKGYVSDSANHAIANRTVRIYNTDSTNTACLIAHTVTTNPNGYYIDTLSCTGDIRAIQVIVENCDGSKLVQKPAISSNNVVECNFKLSCIPVPLNCKAAFSYKSLPSGISFTSAGSLAAPGDSIISRTWNFGDSSASLTGNRLDPSHNYLHPGTYQVCLTIATRGGCSSSYCQSVTFTPAADSCHTEVHITMEKVAARNFRFNSSTTIIQTGDSIFQRIWSFGDGSSLDGNLINPLKTYRDTGNFTACLTIHTIKGCSGQICIQVPVHDSVPAGSTACQSKYSFQITGSNVTFNSASAYIPVGDSIISRTWVWGDNTANLTGNRVDPSHIYPHAGHYNACLYIQTKNGCQSSYCADFTIRDSVPPTTCKAAFGYTIKDSLVAFNSAGSTVPSGDSIISRTWVWGDNTANLTGNRVDPSHIYPHTGHYNACLYIQTKNGCQSSYCADFTIRDSLPPTGCKAVFTHTVKDSLALFNSAGSNGVNTQDSIISRIWTFNESGHAQSLSGNFLTTSYVYKQAGTYAVTLQIKTQQGCTSSYTDSVTITKPVTDHPCKAVFTKTIRNAIVYFNSADAKGVNLQDSILSRIWLFGGNSAPLQGNQVQPVHTYPGKGKYPVALYIKTASGCESKFTDTVIIEQINCPVTAAFTWQRVSQNKVQFNSSNSQAITGDSIIQRTWKFGDNTVLSGNTVQPLKEFRIRGIYQTCLTVRTLNGCSADTCERVMVQDTINTTPAPENYVKILQINPNPVVTRMVATIYSRNNNIDAEIFVYDIYGQVKLSMKKSLLQGNNMLEVITDQLYHGPYFLVVRTNNGKDSKAFYKL